MQHAMGTSIGGCGGRQREIVAIEKNTAQSGLDDAGERFKKFALAVTGDACKAEYFTGAKRKIDVFDL